MASGAGFIFHMINSFKSNRELRNRHSKFKNNNKDDKTLGAKGKLYIKPITKEELQSVRSKTLASNRKRLRLLIILFSLTFIPMLFFGIKALVNMKQQNIAYNIRLIESKEKERLNTYQQYIQKGDYWLNEKQFYNAANCYYKAYLLDVNKDEANKRLITAYIQECITENRHCKLAVNTILQYLESHPEEKDLIEKMELCKAISDSE